MNYAAPSFSAIANSSAKPARKGVSNRCLIKSIALRREIPFLVHFTPIENLATILRYGLLSRERLEALGIRYYYNDTLRLDGHLNATSLSIAYPNEPMFHDCRKRARVQGWVVLIIDPSVLWENNNIFCKYNATSKTVRNMSRGFLQTARAFENMFEARTPNDRFGLNENDPTYLQAEVMTFDDIHPSKIWAAEFTDTALAQYYQPYLEQQGKGCLVDQFNFFYRRAFARTPKHLFQL